jgi:lysozyme
LSINVVIDLSHHNIIKSFEKVRDAGIRGIIHKATQGLSFTDQKYRNRKLGSLEAEIMWGAYHFAALGNGKEQADYFLDFVKPAATDLLVLDYESFKGKIIPEQKV